MRCLGGLTRFGLNGGFRGFARRCHLERSKIVRKANDLAKSSRLRRSANIRPLRFRGTWSDHFECNPDSVTLRPFRETSYDSVALIPFRLFRVGASPGVQSA